VLSFVGADQVSFNSPTVEVAVADTFLGTFGAYNHTGVADAETYAEAPPADSVRTLIDLLPDEPENV